MTLKLTKSEVANLPFDFEAAVTHHINELKAWTQHGNARPVAKDIVEAAVKRVQFPPDAGKPDDFVADYQIEDDPKPAPLSFEQKVQLLRSKVRDAESLTSIALAGGPGKARLLALKIGALRAKPEADHTAEDRAVQRQAADLQAQRDALAIRAAEVEAVIDELTEDTVDGFVFEGLA